METELEYWQRKLKELNMNEPHYPQKRQRIKKLIEEIEKDQDKDK